MSTARENEGGKAADEIAHAEELEALAAAEARGDIESPPLYPTRASRSEVFSVRLPEAAATKLRLRAEAEGVSPGVLMRQWAMSVLTGQDDSLVLTHEQAEALFRATLQRVATETIESVRDAAATGQPPVNLGPRLVHQTLRERRRPA